MSESTRVRFAPSPTGYLHVGGARTALFNWLYARHTGGTFVLRIEDTDAARDTPEANQAIFDGLNWLGLSWDEGPDRAGGDYGPYRQSERKEIYDRYFAKLEAAGLLYDDEGSIRFKAPNAPVTIDDLVRGNVVFNDRQDPDMTIRRANGSYIFHFVSVVDDIEMKISHVIRGEDHLSNTPKHIDLYHALGADLPRFAHIPLIMNQDGTKMSKRDQGASIREYIEGGFIPEAVLNYICLLGWSPGEDREILSHEELINLFDINDVNRSSMRFDMQKCRWMNQKYLQALSDDAFLATARAGYVTRDAPDEALALARPRLETFAELDSLLHPILNQDADVAADAAAKIKENLQNAAIFPVLAGHLETADWTEDGIKDAINRTAEEFDVKPGKIMFPLRVMAMGVPHGTDLIPSLLLIGREETARRIRARQATLFPE